MNKIMFNDKYGLTQAVLEGRKTMTRRIVPEKIQKLLDAATKPIIVPLTQIPDGQSIEEFAEQFAKDYKAAPLFIRDGKEEVKVEPSEKEIMAAVLVHSAYKVGDEVAVAQKYKDFRWPAPQRSDFQEILHSAGWNNKMFVRADLMPHHIRITDVSLERLRDINSEDCLKEGIEARIVGCHTFYFVPGIDWPFHFPKPAFAALIDKVSGKGTFDSNPWVYVYTFDLVK